MNISIVIVTYHTGEVLKQCISALNGYNVVVIDNGNPPEVSKWLEKQKVKYIKNKNTGFAASCNLGAKNCSGDLYLFLNPDCIPATGSIERAIQVMQNNQSFWLAGCRVLLNNGAPQKCNIREILSPQTAIGGTGLYKLGIGKKLNIDEIELPQGEIVQVPSVSGAWILIKRDAFQKLGGWDENFFLHVEDADLCKRVNDMGGKVGFIKEITATHSASSSKTFRLKLAIHKTASFCRYFKKHYGILIAILMLPLVIVNFLRELLIPKKSA